jgi:serine phosphatase RsbU (regulator of sigma subunit)
MNGASHRWFSLTIYAGMALGLLLLGNSAAHYFWFSERIVADQVRRDLSAKAIAAENLLSTARPANRAEAAEMLEQIRATGDGRIAWIQLRDSRDTTLAGAGLDVSPTFPAGVVRSRLRDRQPAVETRLTPNGKVLVEAFLVRMPAAVRPSSIQLAAYTPTAASPRATVGVIEIAAYLEGAGNLWPLQRNLLINSSSALALLGALVAIRVRFRAYLEGIRLSRQLDDARRVQRELLPAARAQNDGLAVSGLSAPASEMNGDFYDVFQVRGNGAGIVLADVSGKGVPAAMLAAVVQGAVRSSAWAGSGHRHVEATRQLNRLLCERASGERYASLFWAYFAPESNALRYVNAGHLPPLVFPAAHPGAAHRLTSGGPVLGLLPAARFEQGEHAFEPGDILVLYSDGIVEAENAAGEEFGEDRIRQVVAAHRDADPEAIRNAVLAACDSFTGNAAAADDRTLLVIRYAGPSGSGAPVPASSPDHRAEPCRSLHPVQEA